MLRNCVALFALFWLSGLAEAREVTIALQDSQSTIILTNPSTVTVTYDIACYKSDGSAISSTSATNQSLAPNARATHTSNIPDSGKCSGGTPPQASSTDSSGKSFYLCTGSNDYANASNACGSGNAFCFPDITTTSYVSGCSANSFWLYNDGNAQINGGCAGYAAVTGGNQIVIGPSCTYYNNARKSSSAGACSGFFYAGQVATSTTAGAVCCSSPTPGSVCKITITNTSKDAYLSSPSFLGGAAF